MDRPVRAVWAASRAAIRRRRLQTIVITLVVLLSTTTLVIGLGMLNASNAPFDQAFSASKGAHLTVAFDPARITMQQLDATARAPGVTAAAGPFQTAQLPHPLLSGFGYMSDLLVVGRADPGGPVERVTLTSGRWVSGPGEIVLGDHSSSSLLGHTLTSPGLPALTVVGTAASATLTANGWVSPQQMASLNPNGIQMLYRFSGGQADQGLRTLTADVPGRAIQGSQSYLAVKRQFQLTYNQMIPFIVVFGTLALVVSVLIIANAVSGAVISGFRQIGIMKSLGFTPVQVTSVYVVMIAVPALAGCVAGLVTGDLIANTLGAILARGVSLPPTAVAGAWTDLAAALAILALTALSAIIPAVRAGRLPAVQAISTRSVGRAGRGRRMQRLLARAPLPRPVSLGLSLPLARPGRGALSLAIIFVATTATVFAAGLHETVVRIQGSGPHSQAALSVVPAPPAVQAGWVPPDARSVLAQLRSQPGTAQVMAEAVVAVSASGVGGHLFLKAYEGDDSTFLTGQLLSGRLFRGPGEALATEGFLKAHNTRIGDTLNLTAGDHHTTLRIVGSVAAPGDNIEAGWSTMAALSPMVQHEGFLVRLKPGADPAALTAAFSPPERSGLVVTSSRDSSHAILDGLFLMFTVIICVAAGLGVLNAAVLTTRDRSRDIGVLKALGMSPRQVRSMVIISMGVLGVLGGLAAIPAGVLAHHWIAVFTGDLINSGMRQNWIHVYSIPLLAAVGCAGVLIAVLGALLPAGWAARTRTATVLRSE